MKDVTLAGAQVLKRASDLRCLYISVNIGELSLDITVNTEISCIPDA